MTDRDAGTRDSLPSYTVVSLEKDAAAEASGHSHVLALTTTDPDGGETRWTLVQVIAAIRDGERFVLGGGDGEAAAEVEPAVCPRCPYATLVVERTGPAPARVY